MSPLRLALVAVLVAMGCTIPDHAAIAAEIDGSATSPAPAPTGAKRKKKAAEGDAASTPSAAPTGAKTDAGVKKEGGKSGGAAGKKGGRGGGGLIQPVEVTTISRRDLVESLSVVGSLGANETASIRPEMAGIIRSVNFEEGFAVKKGDLLLKIDDQELQAQVDQSKARFELAKQNLARAESLQQTLSNTQADVDRSRSEFAAAQADRTLLEVRLRRTEIRAPFDGVVGSRTLSPGDFINTQSIVTTIYDLSRLKAEFQVPERYVAKVHQGTPFTVKSTTASINVSTQGDVYFVNSIIDRNTRSSEVKGYLINPPPQLKAGMFAVFEIILEVRKQALAVPEGAIFVDQRGPQLVVVKDQGGDKIVSFVPVALGLRIRGLVEVIPLKDKVDENTTIVAAGVGQLALFPGAKVEPRPLRAEFRLTE